MIKFGWGARQSETASEFGAWFIRTHVAPLRAQGWGSVRIAAELNRRGIRNRYGRPWSRVTLRQFEVRHHIK